MTTTEYYGEQDRPLLVLPMDSENFRMSRPAYGNGVTRGAVNLLVRWPGHVLQAFITGCLFLVAIIIIWIITAVLIVSLHEKGRIARSMEANYLPNVYFIKHENRTWSSQEFCYIETTARKYENHSIYLINLLDDYDDFHNRRNSSIIITRLLEPKDEAEGYAEPPISVEIVDRDGESAIKRQESLEQQSREKLSASNANIKNIDVPIGGFFNGSRLGNMCNRLSENMVEIAAKAYVLWNFPGVALDPGMYRSLEFLNEYLSKKIDGESESGRDSAAAIELHGDIQASSVPCQAFLDHLIRQISINEFPDQRDTLKKAIGDFCPRPSRCEGVRLLDRIPKTEVSEETLNCPTVITANGGQEDSKEIRNVSETL